jgi:hypothetical protein
MSATTNDDALGYLEDLREAIRSPFIHFLLPNVVILRNSPSAARWEASLRLAEQRPDVRDTAVAIISALGFCRIYGIMIPIDLKTQLASPLPIELLAPAISGMLRLLESSTDDARTLPSRFDDSEPLEDRSHCSSILHSLMELWAMYIVVDDEYQRCLSDSHDPSFKPWMHRLLDAFSRLDAEVQRDEQIQLLSIAAELPLLDNWRKMLAEPYREYLPWWLDGTLEDAALKVHLDILKNNDWDVPETQGRSVTIANQTTNAFSFAVDTEYAMAAAEDLSPLSDSSKTINQSIIYLSTHFLDILRHGQSKIWFEITPEGELVRHTYDEMIAADFPNKTGPHTVPILVDQQKIIEPDVEKLENWLTQDVGLQSGIVESVFIRLRLK